MRKVPATEVDEGGYLVYTDSKRYVHRWVMEKKLGRMLRPGETVHHINGNKLDNRPENLKLVTRKGHFWIHAWPLLLAKAEAQIKRTLVPQLEAQIVKTIVIGFAIAGVVLLILGLITKAKLDMWYIGLVLLVADLVAWYSVARKAHNDHS